MEKSWAQLFRENVRHKLPVEELARHFSREQGRPSKDAYVMLGSILLMQMFDLSLMETSYNLAFNAQWHYALDITEPGDATRYACPRTLHKYWKIVCDHKIDERIEFLITTELAHAYDAPLDRQRLDSLHICSNMARIGRIRIMSRVISGWLVNMERRRPEVFANVSSEIIERYLGPKKENRECFAMVKPGESAKTLKLVASDLYTLVTAFQNDPSITRMNTFQKMERVLSEQCTIAENDGRKTAIPKESKEVASNSLQNPSDPDAAYSGHKGQGYQIQISEAYTTEEDPEKRAQTLNLITYVAVESADKSDANALVPAIEALTDRGFKPESMLADTAYAGDANHQAAAEMGVDLIGPTPGKQKKSGGFFEKFSLDAEGHVATCPHGHAPHQREVREDRYVQVFDIRCAECPDIGNCPVSIRKNDCVLRYQAKDVRLAKRRQQEKTSEFKERYRCRAGIEATNSQLDRMTGIKHLRYRGMDKVRASVMLKVTGVNIFRANKVRLARLRAQNSAQKAGAGLFFVVFRATKAIRAVFALQKFKIAAKFFPAPCPECFELIAA